MLKNFINEFKKFAMRGNVIDMAVGIIIGAAFGKIVTALTDSVIMPLVSLVLGKGGVKDISFSIGSIPPCSIEKSAGRESIKKQMFLCHNRTGHLFFSTLRVP